MAHMVMGSSTAPLDIPHTQNTAPVLEFRCMFTSDLRRKKQKRWQDGRLKFHTFNKRIMIYDERSNFVGDTHWKKAYDLEAGEELELDRGGVLVQVDEYLRKENQDLHDLLTKRVKEKEERASARTAASPLRSVSIRPQNFATPSAAGQPQSHGSATTNGISALRPRPSNAVIGNPTGHYGRALASTYSPFEQRLANKPYEDREERPAKRQRRVDSPPSKSDYAQSLRGATLTLSSKLPSSAGPIRYEPLRISRLLPPSTSKPIDLTVDDHEDANGAVVRSRARTDKDNAEDHPKTSNWKARRSLPQSSGYASKLTGAALSLGSREVTRKRDVPVVNIKMVGETSPQPQLSSSSDAEGDQLSNSSPMHAVTAPTKRKVTLSSTNGVPKPKSAVDNRSSSPAPSTLIKDVNSKHRATPILNQPADETSLNRPVSSLRIKARPPRKMMMLMQRRGSGPLERVTSNARSQPLSLNSGRQDPVPSQSTKRLDYFCQKQADLLTARLKGKKLSPDVKGEDPSLSPIDSGIDTATLDLLSIRRRRQDSEQMVATTSASWQARVQRGQMSEADLRLDQSNEKDITRRSPGYGSQPVNAAGNTAGNSAENAAAGSQDLLGIVIKKLNSSVSNSGDPRSQEPNLESVEGNKDGSGGTTNLLQSDSGGTFSATDRFREIIKISPSARTQGLNPSSPSPDDRAASRTMQSRDALMDESNRTAGRVIIKPSPKLSPPILNENNITYQAESSRPNVHLQLSDNPGSGPPTIYHPTAVPVAARKPRLANPATSGRSLLTIANQTADAAAPLPPFNSVTSPLNPRISIAPGLEAGRDCRREGRVHAGMMGTVERDAIAGPWSREAFDLFGSWRPPGRQERRKDEVKEIAAGG